jgi:hypothetical protein
MTRLYDFDLPVHLSGMVASSAPQLLQAQNLWDNIPKSLQTKLLNASFFSGIDITREELDQVDDETWDQIKQYVGSQA